MPTDFPRPTRSSPRFVYLLFAVIASLAVLELLDPLPVDVAAMVVSP